MKKHAIWKKLLQGVYRYLLFFLLIAFLVSCTMSLFVAAFSADLDLTLSGENLRFAAKLTFLNVIVLSTIITAIDALRRKFTTERISKHILMAAKRIVQGDFEVRVEPVGKALVDEHYIEIIDCFNKMAQELQSVDTLRTDFIADVSHEMKTPLSVIQNYGTLLQAPQLSDEERMEYARGVTGASRKMADMMTNILKLNRLENQKIFPQRDEFDLGEQLCECLLQYETVWEEADIGIETQIDDGVIVKADRELLGLVWNNLLSNAFKFTPSGGKVSVTLSQEENCAVVRVCDTGCGISAEVGAHMFEKFYQGDTSRSVQGNGLGLALVKRVIDILCGEIDVESTPGKGSAFTVKIRRS